MNQMSLLRVIMGLDCMFYKLKSNLHHPGTLCLSLAYWVFVEMVCKKTTLLKSILVFSYLLWTNKTFWIIYFSLSLIMYQKTIVVVMSLGDKMGVPITVLTLFGRFDKRWRLQIVFFIFLMNKPWYNTCSISSQPHTIISYLWTLQGGEGFLWDTL
jgi:hypothetical protein